MNIGNLNFAAHMKFVIM